MAGEVARGGMGAILRVYDDDLRRPLAMKVVLGDPGHGSETPKPEEIDQRRMARFLEEALGIAGQKQKKPAYHQRGTTAHVQRLGS